MMLIQVILLAFLLFALSRVVLRFRGGQISPLEFGFWSLLFVAAAGVVLFPQETSRVATFLGIGRGADLVVYASIVVLFYLVFRIYVLMEDLRHEITKLVRELALEKTKRRK